MDKFINPMRTRDAKQISNFNSEIKTLLLDASKLILAKLVDYYDQAVVGEQEFLVSLNDKLAEFRLFPEEQTDIDSFEASISFKKEIIHTKLEKRRISKIQKLLNPVTERVGSMEDSSPPTCTRGKNKKKNKSKKKFKGKKNKSNSGNKSISGTNINNQGNQGTNSDQPVSGCNNGPNRSRDQQSGYRFRPGHGNQERDGGPGSGQGWYHNHGPNQGHRKMILSGGLK